MLPHYDPSVRRSRVEPHLHPRPGLRAMPRQRRRHPTGHATSLPPRHHPAHRHGRHPLHRDSRLPETPTLERIYRRRCLLYLTQTKNIVISTGANGAPGERFCSLGQGSRSHREQRSGETCFSTHTASQPILLLAFAVACSLLPNPKQTSSRPKQRTVLSSVAQWRDPCISSLFLSLYRSTP